MKTLSRFLMCFAILGSSLCLAQSGQTNNAAYWRAMRNDGGPGFICAFANCGIQVGYVAAAGDLHGGTLTADGAMTSGSVSTGALTATDITVSSVTSSGSATVSDVLSNTVRTGPLTATSATVSNTTTTKDLVVTGNVQSPGFTSDPNGQMTFSKPPQGVATYVCTNVTTPVALGTLYKAFPVATLTSAAFKVGVPCVSAPPTACSADVDTFCRVTSAGNASIYARSGLVGQTASSGQWCAQVVGG